MMKRFGASLLLCFCLLLLFSADVSAKPGEDFSPLWPVKGSYQVNSLDYYYSSGTAHRPMKAIDIGRNGATTHEILAVAAGTVVAIADTDSATSYGNNIVIDHENGYFTRYAHLKEDSISVTLGQKVTAGQKIALMGATGNVTGIHLHFEIGTSRWMGTLEYALDYFLVDDSIYPLLNFAKGLEQNSERYSALIRSCYTKLSGSYYSYNGRALDLGFIDDEQAEGPAPEPEPADPEPEPADPEPEDPAPIDEGVTSITIPANTIRSALAEVSEGAPLVITMETPSTTTREYTVRYSELYSIANASGISGLEIGDDYGYFIMDKLFATGLISRAERQDVTFCLSRSAGSGDVLMNYKMEIRNASGQTITAGGIGRCTAEVAYTASDSGLTLAVYFNGTAIPQSAYLSDGQVVRWCYEKNGTYQLMNNVVIFTDTVSHWAKDRIHFLAARSVINGMGAGTFVPEGEITRAEFLKMVAVISGDDMNYYSNSSFSDNVSGDWYFYYVNWAAANNIVNGVTETTFEPNSEITREQMATMLYRFARYLSYDIMPVRDQVDFADSGQISDYAKDAVGKLYRGGMIDGRGNNLFVPLATAVRAEAATLVSNFMAGLILEPQING